MQTHILEWRHLEVEGATCCRCESSGKSVIEAIERLNHECAPQGVRFLLQETRLSSAALDQSNSLLIDGVPLEQLLEDSRPGESSCPSCADLIGAPTVNCRTLSFDGETREDLPVDWIRRAVCKTVDCCR